MYEYPYGNSQQLNLDWILNKVKEFENSGASSADMKSIANALLSASYDAGSAYAVNDVVYNDTLETLYICNTAIPVGGEPWDATHWDAFRVGEVLTFLFNTIQNLPSDNIANNSNVTGTGLTAALNALVEDIEYSNHYLQKKKNGVYTDVIPIEDTPSNNSDRLASSKAAYDLKGAIDAITPLDSTPTNGSTKGITSDAVYVALAPIGALVTGEYLTSEIPTGTVTDTMSVTLTNGTWLIFGYFNYDGGFTTGRALAYLLQSSYTLSQLNNDNGAPGGGAFPVSTLINITDSSPSKTIRMSAYQTSGTQQTISTRRLNAVRIK